MMVWHLVSRCLLPSPRTCGAVVLASLSRSHHPVGASVNGLEVLDDNPKARRPRSRSSDPKERQDRLRRFAVLPPGVWSAGSAGAQIDLGDAQTMRAATSRTQITIT